MEDVQRANRAQGTRNPMQPPWGVVPVQIIRGDWLSQHVGGAYPTRLGEGLRQMERAAGNFPSWYAPDMSTAARTVWPSRRTWTRLNGATATTTTRQPSTFVYSPASPQAWTRCITTRSRIATSSPPTCAG